MTYQDDANPHQAAVMLGDPRISHVLLLAMLAGACGDRGGSWGSSSHRSATVDAQERVAAEPGISGGAEKRTDAESARAGNGPLGVDNVGRGSSGGKDQGSQVATLGGTPGNQDSRGHSSGVGAGVVGAAETGGRAGTATASTGKATSSAEVGGAATGAQPGGGSGDSLASSGGSAGSSCGDCMPAHCTDGLFEPELGELMLDCGGDCAQNCHCGDRVEPSLGTDCFTNLIDLCSVGTVTCDSDSIRCAPSHGTPERCDGIDNDCNGLADFPYELVDADGDQQPACVDSDDADPDNWISRGTCVDRDRDGFFVGCDAYRVRKGPDCNDRDANPGSCAKNVILFIGDGMGFNHLRAGRCFKNGNSAPLVLETLPERGNVTTANVWAGVTDSAAAATAMATGRKVSNGVLSVAIPGNEADLETALDLRKARGQATGLVTIHDSILGATPAGFGAHVTDRNATLEISNDLRTKSQPNLLFGTADDSLVPNEFAAVGYTVVDSEQALLDLEPDSSRFLLGLFPSDSPTLPVQTAVALEFLGRAREGFFLMVEQADTDKQSHNNNLSSVVEAVVALDAAVEVARTWSAQRTDTLILVTADHETGGLICGLGDFEPAPAGVIPDCTFTSGGHTGVNVPIFAEGVGAEGVAGTIDNTDIFELIAGTGP